MLDPGKNPLPSSFKLLVELISLWLYNWDTSLLFLLVISWDDTQLLEATLRFLPCGHPCRKLTRWQFTFLRPSGEFLSPICWEGVSLISQIPSEECVLRREWLTGQICQERGAWRIFPLDSTIWRPFIFDHDKSYLGGVIGMKAWWEWVQKTIIGGKVQIAHKMVLL